MPATLFRALLILAQAVSHIVLLEEAFYEVKIAVLLHVYQSHVGEDPYKINCPYLHDLFMKQPFQTGEDSKNTLTANIGTL